MPTDSKLLQQRNIPRGIELAIEGDWRSEKRIGLSAYAGTFGTSILIQGFTVLQGITLARLLGPLGRGQYAAVLLWPTIFAGIGIFGINVAVARAAAHSGRYNEVLRTAILLALMTASISTVFCYFTLPDLLPQNQIDLLELSRLFVPFIVLNHLALNLAAVDQGAANFGRFNLTRGVLSPVYFFCLIILWVCAIADLKWVVCALLLANSVVVALRLILALRGAKLYGALFSPWSIVRDSAKFGLVEAVRPLYLQVDKAVLLWVLGSEQLGLYAVALSASAAIGTVTTSAGIVSFSVTTHLKQGQGFEVVATTFRVCAILWLILGGLLALGLPYVLPLVYGSGFRAAVNPARLLIAGSAFAGLASLLDQALRGQGRALIGLEARVGALLTVIIVGIPLSKILGLPGMCLAYGLGQAFCLLLFLWRAKEHFRDARKLSQYLPRINDIKAAVSILARIVNTSGKVNHCIE